jgi:hypothetical protein
MRLINFYYKIIKGRKKMKGNIQQAFDKKLKFCLEIHFDLDPIIGLNVRITGWALGQSEIYKLVYSCKKNSYEIPVCLPRPDVYELINSNHEYPFGNAYFSGIFSKIILNLDSSDVQNNLQHNINFTDHNKKIIYSMSFVLIPNEKIILSV